MFGAQLHELTCLLWEELIAEGFFETGQAYVNRYVPFKVCGLKHGVEGIG